MLTYNYYGNMVLLLEWLHRKPPTDIHQLSSVNQQETCLSGQSKTVEIVQQDSSTELSQYQEQFSQGSFFI
jgi:hypothetical protein